MLPAHSRHSGACRPGHLTGVSLRPVIVSLVERCIACGQCVQDCPEAALFFGQNGIARIDEHCSGCLNCLEICPSRTHQIADGIAEIRKVHGRR